MTREEILAGCEAANCAIRVNIWSNYRMNVVS